MADDSEAAPRGGGVPGRVAESLPNALYRVDLESGGSVLAHVEIGLRQLIPRLIPGDRVEVAVSPYDSSRGRIVSRARRSGPVARPSMDRDEDGER
ncbi:translation initiation factor IF-1 [Myxococcota bacterium]|nr:translation initiation factor IF-1 [Myxococcota bacterium]